MDRESAKAPNGMQRACTILRFLLGAVCIIKLLWEKIEFQSDKIHVAA